MNTAVIYYSLEGNMDLIARTIGENEAVDLFRLIPQKKYPTGKISKYFWGGKSVTFGERPKLANQTIDLEQYEVLVIGTPIWAGTLAPPLNTFLHDYSIIGKKIILTATHLGGGADKCFEKMKASLNGNTIIGAFQFKEPLQQMDDNIDEKIEKIRTLIEA